MLAVEAELEVVHCSMASNRIHKLCGCEDCTEGCCNRLLAVHSDALPLVAHEAWSTGWAVLVLVEVELEVEAVVVIDYYESSTQDHMALEDTYIRYGKAVAVVAGSRCMGIHALVEEAEL